MESKSSLPLPRVAVIHLFIQQVVIRHLPCAGAWPELGLGKTDKIPLLIELNSEDKDPSLRFLLWWGRSCCLGSLGWRES